MSSSIDLFIFGPSASNHELSAGEDNINVIGIDLTELGEHVGEALNRAVSQSEADYLAFCDSSGENELASVASAGVQLSSSKAHCHLRGSDEGLNQIWSQFPAELAVLVRPIGLNTNCLFRRTSFETVGPFRDLDEPIWEWIIRAAATGPEAVAFQAGKPADSCEESTTFPALAPQQPSPARNWLRDVILKLDLQGTAVRAGLFQLHDYLDESHNCSQSIEGNSLGDHWHAIMHRREPDYSNAKYWCHCVGNSPLFGELAIIAEKLFAECADPRASSWRKRLGIPDSWDAFSFVDLCSECAGDGSALERAAEQVQFHEMRLLLAASLNS